MTRARDGTADVAAPKAAFVARMEALPTGLGADEARVHREAIATDQPFGDTAFHVILEQSAEEVALTEAAMPRLGEGGVVRHIAV